MAKLLPVTTKTKKETTKQIRGLSAWANYTDQATAACWRS
jgi:hypothetical protein